MERGKKKTLNPSTMLLSFPYIFSSNQSPLLRSDHDKCPFGNNQANAVFASGIFSRFKRISMIWYVQKRRSRRKVEDLFLLAQ